MKLVNSLARPGGNITGLTHIAVELSAKRLAFFKEAFPDASRAALLVNANDQQGCGATLMSPGCGRSARNDHSAGGSAFGRRFRAGF